MWVSECLFVKRLLSPLVSKLQHNFWQNNKLLIANGGYVNGTQRIQVGGGRKASYSSYYLVVVRQLGLKTS